MPHIRRESIFCDAVKSSAFLYGYENDHLDGGRKNVIKSMSRNSLVMLHIKRESIFSDAHLSVPVWV